MIPAVFIGGDYAQIETRVIAWLAGEERLLSAFREDRDVYSEFGTQYLFGYPVDKSTPFERQLSKVTVLGCVFGMSAATFHRTCTVSGIEIDMPTAERAVNGLRSYVPSVVRFWYSLRDAVASLCGEAPPVRVGKLTVRPGMIVKPNGTPIYYDNLRYDGNDLTFSVYGTGRERRVKLWHGLLAENVTQSVARDVLATAVTRLLDDVSSGKLPPWMEPILTVHDDLLCRVPKFRADQDLRTLQQIMSTPPDWAPDLPVKVEMKKGDTYGDL